MSKRNLFRATEHLFKWDFNLGGGSSNGNNTSHFQPVHRLSVCVNVTVKSFTTKVKLNILFTTQLQLSYSYL